MSSQEQALLMDGSGGGIVPSGPTCNANSGVPYSLYKLGTATTLATQVSGNPYAAGMLGPVVAGAFTLFQYPASLSGGNTCTSYTLNATTGTITTGATFPIPGSYPNGIVGTTDTPLLAYAETTGAVYTFETLSGSISYHYTLNENNAATTIRFARSGTTILFGWNSQGSKKVYKHNVSGGAYVLASAALPDYAQSILIIGTNVYVSATNNNVLYVLDLATLTLQSTIAFPSGITTSGSTLFLVNGNLSTCITFTGPAYYILSYVGGMWRYVGTYTQYLLTANGFQVSFSQSAGRLLGTYTYSGTTYFLQYPISAISQPQSLLLHFDGVNGSTTFTDSSGDGVTFNIAAGTPALSTAQAKYGPSSLLGGTGTNACRVVGTLFPLTNTSVSWTFRCWVYRISSVNLYCGVAFWNSSNEVIRLKTANEGGTYQLSYVHNSSEALLGATSIPLNTWIHLCVSVQYVNPHYNIYFFVNGALDASLLDGTGPYVCPNSVFEIGRDFGSGQSGLDAYIDEYEIIPGYAIVPQSFFSPTSAFPSDGSDVYWADVGCLLHCDGVNNSTYFPDSSTESLIVSALGTAKISTAQSKFGGASAFFSGTSGDRLQAASMAGVDITTQDFTVECWVNFSSTATICGLINKSNTTGAGPYALGLNSSGKFQITVTDQTATNVVVISGTTTPIVGQWYFVAATRQGTNLYLFVNGFAEAQSLGTVTFTLRSSSSDALCIGGYSDNSHPMNGYIDEIRISKGIARYTNTGGFTPPAYASCDGTNGGSGGLITNGTAYLTSNALTTTQGALSIVNPQKQPVGIGMSSAQGTVTPSVQITNPSVALTSQLLTSVTNALTASIPPYPALQSFSAYISSSNTYGASGDPNYVTIVLNNDGTMTGWTSSGYNTLAGRKWIDNTSTSYTIPSIAQYFTAVIGTGANASYVNTSGMPATLATGGSVFVEVTGSGYSISVPVSITVIPTTASPMYGKSGYMGSISLTIQFSDSGIV